MQGLIRYFTGDAIGRDAPSAGRGISLPAGHVDAIAQAAAAAKVGDLTGSLSILAAQLAQDPDNPELLYARALTLSDWGRFRESLDSLRAAEARGLDSFGLQLNAAQICNRLGFSADAERRASRAVSLDRASARAHLCLATVLHGAGRYQAAERSYEKALELAPDSVECLQHLAACKLEQTDDQGAEALMRRAIALGGDQARSWSVLGIALARQDRRDEALAAFERGEEIEARTGQRVGTFLGHGLALVDFGRLSEALELYERHLPSQPDPLGQGHYAFALLGAGRYREGWEQYEFRRLQQRLLSVRPEFGRPEWSNQCLQGKTVLIWAEQGIGDTIHFARFAPQLKSQGATVLLRVREQLQEFARYFVGIDGVVVEPEGVATVFDYHIPTMSLPRVLCPDEASIPANIPYLKTDPVRVHRWRETLAADGLKVGIVWAGNAKHERDRDRSVDLSWLAPLWSVDGIQYYSLQKERRAKDAEHFPANARLIDLAPQLHDFCETAAAIEGLDLVITVDTAVAHVAGALGKPVWVLLAAAADFRWLIERDDSPWYPTMRLFRQQRLGEWGEAVSRVEQALRVAVQNQRGGDRLLAPLPIKAISIGSASPALRSSDRPATIPDLSRVVETRYGIMQYMPRKDDLARSIELYGEWLQPLVDLLGKLLRPGSTILEASAGIGAHVLALARMNGPEGHLLAYEEDRLLRRVLAQNVQAGRLDATVTVMERQLTGPSVAKDPEGTGDDAADPSWATTETIDGLLLERLHLIKLNDGRRAHALLSGAVETLWALRPTLFLGVEDGDNLLELADYSWSFGYRCWRMESKLFNACNFNRRDSDIFPGQKAVVLVATPEESEIDITSDQCVELRS